MRRRTVGCLQAVRTGGLCLPPLRPAHCGPFPPSTAVVAPPPASPAPPAAVIPLPPTAVIPTHHLSPRRRPGPSAQPELVERWTPDAAVVTSSVWHHPAPPAAPQDRHRFFSPDLSPHPRTRCILPRPPHRSEIMTSGWCGGDWVGWQSCCPRPKARRHDPVRRGRRARATVPYAQNPGRPARREPHTHCGLPRRGKGLAGPPLHSLTGSRGCVL